MYHQTACVAVFFGWSRDVQMWLLVCSGVGRVVQPFGTSVSVAQCLADYRHFSAYRGSWSAVSRSDSASTSGSTLVDDRGAGAPTRREEAVAMDAETVDRQYSELQQKGQQTAAL